MRTLDEYQVAAMVSGAETQIREAYLELAEQLEWLAEGHNIMATPVTGECIGLDHEYWDGLATQFAAVEHARHCYNEGEYQLALGTLPEF